MKKMSNYKFYMQKQPIDGVEQKVYDLEEDFKGLKYAKCEGIELMGKPKNKYTESYSDANEVRYWEGYPLTREATNITFTFYFLGENRRKVFDSFYNYVSTGKIAYYDTARKKEVLLVLLDEVKPSEDESMGSQPFIQANFKFLNIWGAAKDKDI